jgi:hypothetical protein
VVVKSPALAEQVVAFARHLRTRYGQPE